jgi:hypothetical protein
MKHIFPPRKGKKKKPNKESMKQKADFLLFIILKVKSVDN